MYWCSEPVLPSSKYQLHEAFCFMSGNCFALLPNSVGKLASFQKKVFNSSTCILPVVSLLKGAVRSVHWGDSFGSQVDCCHFPAMLGRGDWQHIYLCLLSLRREGACCLSVLRSL